MEDILEIREILDKKSQDFKKWLIETGKNTYIKSNIDDLLWEYSFVCNYGDENKRGMSRKKAFKELFKIALSYGDIMGRKGTRGKATGKNKG